MKLITTQNPEPLYYPILKGKEYKPVTWSAMIDLKASISGIKFRIMYEREGGSV